MRIATIARRTFGAFGISVTWQSVFERTWRAAEGLFAAISASLRQQERQRLW